MGWNRYGPNIVDVVNVVKSAGECTAGLPDGRWVPARALGWGGLPYRLKAAWLVFTGRADALTWPGQ